MSFFLLILFLPLITHRSKITSITVSHCTFLFLSRFLFFILCTHILYVLLFFLHTSLNIYVYVHLHTHLSFAGFHGALASEFEWWMNLKSSMYSIHLIQALCFPIGLNSCRLRIKCFIIFFFALAFVRISVCDPSTIEGLSSAMLWDPFYSSLSAFTHYPPPSRLSVYQSSLSLYIRFVFKATLRIFSQPGSPWTSFIWSWGLSHIHEGLSVLRRWWHYSEIKDDPSK